MLPNFHFSIERWRKNEEYGVWVSSLGRVKLIKNKSLLEPRISKDGYCLVFTQKGPQSVHRLVAYTWLGEKRNEKYNIDHINSNKRDNSVSNLRWIEKNLNTEYAQYTLSPIDEVDCIEREEEILNKAAEIDRDKKVGVALYELFKNKQVLLKINDTVIENYNQLHTFYVSYTKKNMPTKEEIFTRISTSMRTNTPYCGGVWEKEDR